MGSISQDSLKFGDEDARKNFEKGRTLATCEPGEEVIISGISGAFPESMNMREFEENLLAKKDLVTVTDRRWKDEHEKFSNRMGTIPEINKFDSLFFGMLDKHADTMDPQGRMLLEKTYEAVVDAGYNPRQLKGKKYGVFVGCCTTDTEVGNTSHTGEVEAQIGTLSLPGIARGMLSNRISYWLDINGPSYTLDTACSSSMYAFDQAYRAIRNGQCDGAIVAGCNLCLYPGVTLGFAELGVLSPDGKCKSFDESGDGYVRSESVVVCLLQRKKDARRVYATVVHAKTNEDGYKEEGVHYPSSAMQTKLLEEIYSECQVDPAKVAFVEAHATGTKVGDPAELKALETVFLKNRNEPLRLGSIKSNLGHSEPSSGLNSIAKVILSYETGLIMPNINFVTPRKDCLPLNDGRMKVITEATPWEGGLTGVNSFGFGGANCHILLDSNPKPKKNNGLPGDNLPRLVTASGRTEEAVNCILTDLENRSLDAEYVGLWHEIQKDAIPGHVFRGFTILEKNMPEKPIRSIEATPSGKKSVWYVYAGMGSQWATMGTTLMKIPPFAESIQKSQQILKTKNVDLLKIITTNDASVFDSVLNSYVGIVAIQIALTDTLSALNIRPNGIIGHSMGELCCAYADGCLTAGQTILLAYYRGLANESSKTIPGSMASIGLSNQKLRAILPSSIEIACHNAAENTTITGPKQDVQKFVELMKNQGTFAVEVNSSNMALHSRYIKDAGIAFQKLAKSVVPEPKERSSKWISTTFEEKDWESTVCKTASDEYFLQNVLGTVYFEEACRKIPENSTVIEIAPHGLLQAILKRSLKGVTNIPLTSKIHKDNSMHFLSAVGKIFMTGSTAPQLSKLYPPVQFPVSRGTPMISPLVRWDHSKDMFTYKFAGETAIKNGVRTAKITLQKEENKYLAGHLIDGRNLYPATGYLVFAWETLALMLGKPYHEVSVYFQDVRLHMFTVLTEDAPLELSCALHRNSGDFEITHQGGLIATGKIFELEDIHVSKEPYDYDELERADTPGDDPKNLPLRFDDVYRELRLRGYHCDSLFKGIQRISHTRRVGRISWSNFIAFMDCLLKMRILYEIDQRKTVIPVSIPRVTIDVKKHFDILKTLDPEKPEFPAYITDGLHELHSGGIEIMHVQPILFVRQKLSNEPIVEKFQFVPYKNANLANMEEAIRVCAQIAIDNSSAPKFKVIERIDENYNKDFPLVAHTLTECSYESVFNMMLPDISVIMDNMNRLSEEQRGTLNVDVGQLPEENVCQLIVISEVLNRPEVLSKCMKGLKNGGFLMTKENPSRDIIVDESILDIVFDCVVDKTRVLLLRKKDSAEAVQKEPIFIRITNDDMYKWLPEIQAHAKSDDLRPLVIYAEKESYNGILGFYNCLSKEMGREHVRCFFIMDNNAAPFSPQNRFYATQLQKKLTKNIYKDGKWGSYHHVALGPAQAIPTTHAFVNPTTHGDLSSLRWIEGPLNPITYKPAEHKVLVHVYYAALNFRDIMLATRRLPVDVIFEKRMDQEFTQGLEFVGKTSDGRRVMGTVDSKSIASVLECDVDRLLEVPDDWSLEDGATITTVFGTVVHALITVARIKKGESILIHSGAGGIGLAAIHVALHFECQIFVTVGTPEKRNYIRETFPQIPDSHIGSSRDHTFERVVYRHTNGRGVNIVLNSLAGEKLFQSVQCLAPEGRFLDVGKYDFVQNNALKMQKFLREISFHGVGLNGVFSDRRRTRDMQHLLDSYIKLNVIKPLPRTVFGIDKIEEAYRYMATGKHIGKILIKVRDEEPNLKAKPQILTMNALPRYYGDSEKSYVICGGLGDLGLELADWLILRGARRLLLTSRRGITDGYQASRMRVWQTYNANVVIHKGDITTESGVRSMLQTAKSMGPVVAIFNLAGVLQDSLLENQSQTTFATSAAPKVTTTMLLDKISRILCPQLEHFVVFSSVSCGLGNSGQTNYGWSNSCMERICEKRRADKLPALAIEWGAIGEVGMYARMSKKAPEGIAGGIAAQHIQSCLELMDQFLKQPNVIVLSMVVGKQDQGKKKQFKNLTEAVAHILGLKDLKSIDPDATLSELGLDSIMGVEIAQTLQNFDFSLLNPASIRNMTFSKLLEMEEEMRAKSEAS